MLHEAGGALLSIENSAPYFHEPAERMRSCDSALPREYHFTGKQISLCFSTIKSLEFCFLRYKPV
jgi:hypothetical protein